MRCRRFKLDCVILPHHRGRKTTKAFQNVEYQHSKVKNGMWLGLPMNGNGGLNYPFLSLDSSNVTNIIPLVHMTDPEGIHTSENRVPKDTLDDPVSAGYMSEEDARMFFKQ